MISPRLRVKRHHFLAAWMRSPMKIGALLPSSRSLARAMARPVDVDNPGYVIELGAGTGVVTHALLQHGVDPDKLIVIERDEKLFSIVSSHFPQLRILCADAIQLDQVLRDAGVTKISAIVSSLPLMTMPKPVRRAIQKQMATIINDDSIIVQFTYGPQSPFSRRQMTKNFLTGKRRKMVVTNVPPAHVWVYKRA
jgi:phosphatidylethanolamine/phosphatidyl-N-methylethanolamine N-methyltransferase